MHILPLRDGGIIFGSADPAFGIINREGSRVLFRGPDITDYRGILKDFLVFNDASIVQFGYEQSGKSPGRFSVPEHLLEVDPAEPSNLYPPRTEAPGLAITGWQDTYEPKPNGNPLKLKQYEMSRSLAIAPDNQSFLLGTEWFLSLLDRDGRELWNVPVPGIAWGVNISGNGKTAVAAFGDGTIRWYHMSNGKELLTFFPHKDRKRWMLWSPSGYYDASPGAEELAGWHVNRGKDEAADFFPLSRFRATYYRPDVIAKILEQGDEQEALRLANEETGRKAQTASVERVLPPVVTILDLLDGTVVTSPQLTLRYALRSPSGEPVTAVKTLIDGRPLSISRGITIEHSNEESRQMAITIPERDCEVSLIAENRYAASEPVTVRLRWNGEAPKEEFIVKPKLYVLAVGVGRYTHKGIDKLDLAAKDAVDFADVMKKQQAGLYREVAVKLLTDETATRDEIVDGLDWIRKETTSKDVAIVFLAGHGVNDKNGIYYFLPVNTDLDKLMRTAVPFSDIKNTIASLAGKTVLFVDTCHAGNVLGKRRGGVDLTGFVNELASAENGAVVFASSTGRQYSLEDPAWGNGAFTKAVVEGLSGKTDYNKKGKITINMLDLFISERVKELTKGQQTPTMTKPQTVPDFPIAVVF